MIGQLAKDVDDLLLCLVFVVLGLCRTLGDAKDELFEYLLLQFHQYEYVVKHSAADEVLRLVQVKFVVNLELLNCLQSSGLVLLDVDVQVL